MYKRILILTVTVICVCVVLGFLPVHGEAALYDNVLRLHVLANSDSEEDQELKLLVRDALLEKTSELFDGCRTKDEARAVVENNVDNIRKVAENTIKEAGYDYSVDIELGEEEYPTKSYEACCFPAGEYLSLRVTIGKAEGENWWCVLFPPLCLNAASESREVFAEVGLMGEQYNIITESDSPRYKVRFKLLEAIEGAFG